MSGLGGDPRRRRLGRQSEPEALQQDLLILVRLGIAWQHDLAPVGGRQLDVDHLHGLELVEDGSRGEARRQGAQALLEGDLQAGDEGDKDMRLDAVVELVIDRPDREVAVQLLEGLLDLGEPPRKGGSNPL